MVGLQTCSYDSVGADGKWVFGSANLPHGPQDRLWGGRFRVLHTKLYVVNLFCRSWENYLTKMFPFGFISHGHGTYPIYQTARTAFPPGRPRDIKCVNLLVFEIIILYINLHSLYYSP
jgi:hypothetical protein